MAVMPNYTGTRRANLKIWRCDPDRYREKIITLVKTTVMIFRRNNGEGKTKKEAKDIIAWRGHEVTRIEAFSDAVFGFAITLLVVSLEVPKNFGELVTAMKGFIPFAVCFVLFFQIWSSQNLFFRRFGLHDEATLRLNAMLLFSLLFFVYPLKFLFTAFFNPHAFKEPHEWVELMYVYGGSFAVIYVLFALMYHHAYRRRALLKLTQSEAFETRTYMYRNIGVAMVGLLSITISSFGPEYVPFGGMSYSLIGLVVGMTHSKRGEIHRKKFENQPELGNQVMDDVPLGKH